MMIVAPAFVGIGLGYFVAHIEYDPALTAGNIIQSTTTFVAAVTVALILQPKVGAKAKEKELLLKLYDLALKALDDLGGLKGSDKITEKAASLKVFATRCYTAEQLISSISCYSGVGDTMDFTKDVAELRKLTTDSPLNQLQQDAGTCKRSVREGISQLTEERDREAESKISELALRIIRLQVALNKC